MKRYSCDSDIGSVLIGDENWTFAVPNIGGDGTTEIVVFDSPEEYNASDWRKLTFLSSVQGRFGIFDYDCAFTLKSLNIDDAMVILKGRYGVYHGFYKVAFVRWRET